MTKDEYDDIVDPKVEVKRKFELYGGPLDGERGIRWCFGIMIFGQLMIQDDCGNSLCGSMDMPQYFKSPFYNTLLIYKYVGNMRYEFTEYQ